MASSEAAAKASATRTRPHAFSHLLYDRGVRFAAGLAIVVAIPVAVLFYFQFRALNALEKTSAVVLRQLSQATADAVAKDIEEALKRPYIGVLLRIPQGRTEPLDFEFIEPVFAQGLTESPFVEAFYTWSAPASDSAVGPMYVFNRASLAEEPGEFARTFLAHRPRRHSVRVRLHTSAELARELVNPSAGTIIDEGPSCTLSLETDDLDWAARYLVYLNIDFDVLAPAELTAALHNLGSWLTRRHA